MALAGSGSGAGATSLAGTCDDTQAQWIIGKMPSEKDIEQAKTDDVAEVIKTMKTMNINDAFAKNGKLRDDGKMIHDMYLVKVKTPAESKKPWDYYSIEETVPGNEAFESLSQSKCSLVKK